MSTVDSKARALWSGRRPGVRPGVARAVLAVALVLGAAAGWLATDPAAAASAQAAAGAELTRLLRAMAGLKLLLAAGAVAVTWWRLGQAARAGWLAAYAVAGAAMAAGPMLIWQMAHVAAGAAALHGGLLAAILLLWRDPAVGTRLAGIVARRPRLGRHSAPGREG